MIEYLVICRRKHSLYERIESIGCIDRNTGVEVRFNEDQAIHEIESRTARFAVRDAQGFEAEVEIEERNGRKFLITMRDGRKTDNLLWLPECSSKPIVTPPHHLVTPARSHSAHRDWKQF